MIGLHNKINDKDVIVVMGDLGYCIDTGMENAVTDLKTSNWSDLYEYDQLKMVTNFIPFYFISSLLDVIYLKHFTFV